MVATRGRVAGAVGSHLGPSSFVDMAAEQLTVAYEQEQDRWVSRRGGLGQLGRCGAGCSWPHVDGADR